MKLLKYKLLVDGEEVGKINSPDSLRTLQKSCESGNINLVPPTLLSIYYRLMSEDIMILTVVGKEEKEESALFWFDNHLEFMDVQALAQAETIIGDVDEETKQLTGHTFDELVAQMT